MRTLAWAALWAAAVLAMTHYDQLPTLIIP